MRILLILPILLITITHVYGDERIPLEESHFVTGIFDRNSTNNDIDDIKLLCLGVLMSRKIVVTSTGCRPDNIENLIVGLFNWAKPGNLKRKLITSTTTDEVRRVLYMSNPLYRHSCRNNYGTELEGLYVLQLSNYINVLMYTPINILQSDDHFCPEQFIRLRLNQQENGLVQDNPTKVNNEQCNGPINMNQYKPSIVSCFKNTEIITSSNATECVGQPGSPIIYGHRNARSNKTNYYLYGLMYETKQCMFAYSRFNEESLPWLRSVIIVSHLVIA